MITYILFSVDALLLAYLAWGAFYQLFFAVTGHFYQKPASEKRLRGVRPKVAVFIPAYREDNVVMGVAEAACNHNYPADRFEVMVIADGLQPSTLEQLKRLNLRVMEVSFEKSTKSRALNAALRQLANENRAFDMAVVLDADNIMEHGFLHRMADRFESGWVAIQGRRAPKNHHNGIALLDGASEDINNHILCRGHHALGLSARLAGSGMAFEYNLFAQTMSEIDAMGGFDKELELRLTQQGIRIGYDEAATVLDEKVSRPANFARQRSRWIAAQWHYARRFLHLGLGALVTEGRLDFFNKCVQMTLPPRLLLPVALAGGVLIHLLAGHLLLPFWSTALAASIASFALALPATYFQVRYIRLWLSVPTLVWSTLTALLHIKEAGHSFLHTPKEITTVSAV